MKAILDRLLWIPVKEVDVARLRSNMTVYATAYFGGQTEIKLYEISNVLS